MPRGSILLLLGLEFLPNILVRTPADLGDLPVRHPHFSHLYHVRYLIGSQWVQLSFQLGDTHCPCPEGSDSIRLGGWIASSHLSGPTSRPWP